MQISTQQIEQFQRYIFAWYGENKRDLPWRLTRNPYHILISEVMLQQTQVARVMEKYHIWITKFPDIYSLSRAKLTEVLQIWSGLGYNRRALYLQRLAKEIVADYQGKFPQDALALQSLPGIGKYTANALLCFAFDKQVALVDTNIKKVILTQFLNLDYADVKLIDEVALQILPKGRAYTWNQALMDYSSIKLKNKKIIIPKQTKFKDSDRYYRGVIIKLVIEKQILSFIDIQRHFQHDNQGLCSARLERIINTLLHDSLLKYNEQLRAFSIP